ncbi:MAG TPA: alpha/beta hydrolase [Blastocatellia bacterium]|nr:alpha/beta hydrolase [Blastocatellia bacterium]
MSQEFAAYDQTRNRQFKGLERSRRKFFALILVALFPSSVFYGLRHLERALTFHPLRYAPGQFWNPPAGAEDVQLASSGVRLHGWFIPSAIRPARATVIYFHGNAGNIANVGWLGASLAARGFDALMFDYRGYGRSEGEIRDERDLYSDAGAAYDYIVGERGVSPDRIALYGQSLGTAAVADLASRKRCGAIILESGMSSATDMAAVALPWLPRWLHGMGSNRLESKQKLSLVHCPVLIAHGDPDDTVPTSQGLSLFAAANEPKKLLLVPGAGHNVAGSSGDKYLDEVAAFISEAIAPPN